MSQYSKLIFALSASTVLLHSSCSGPEHPEDIINGDNIASHIKVLSSDEFAGRKPCTAGEDKTIEYIKNEFQKLGLKPGNGSSFFQEVPLVEIETALSGNLKIKRGKDNFLLTLTEEYVGTCPRVKDSLALDTSEMVFAGFGIVAPEYNWNDYEGLDVKGKTVVLLINDPGFYTGDSAFFKGKTMTYYGRWTYKYEEAARQGAEAVLIVHDSDPAGYPWEVVQGSRSGKKLYLQQADSNLSRCAFEGWITRNAAVNVFIAAGMNFDSVMQKSYVPGFKGFSLGMNASVGIKNKFRYTASHNVLAVHPGTDRNSEYIIYTAHWDHLGIGKPEDGDSIYNGAVDNASGIACMIEIARAFSVLQQKTSRSILFLAVTAEEQGLLGSEYYATHPVYPLNKTVAALNMDAMTKNGKMKDITIVGYGQSELDDYAGLAGKEQGRYVISDPDPSKGSFFRSDHFSFAKQGVPALNAKGGKDHFKNGKEWVAARSEEYRKKHYHRPSDEYDAETWDLEGMVQDAWMLYSIGERLAHESTFPKWKPGSEFKAIRERYMK